MNSKTKIFFCFPESLILDKDSLIEGIISSLPDDLGIQYAGFETQESLEDDLGWRFEDSIVAGYQPISTNQKKEIEKMIRSTIERCSLFVPSVQQDLTIFVFPWLPPFDEYDKMMGYVSGRFVRGMILNLFVNSSDFFPESLSHTVAHELNHALFFNNHQKLHPDYPSGEARIKDVLVWEGLAERFSEEVVGTPSKVAGLFTQEQSKAALLDVQERLEVSLSEDTDDYEKIFFGTEKYPRWIGYAIGYQIVKSFREETDLNWGDILKMEPKDLFNQSSFVKDKNKR